MYAAISRRYGATALGGPPSRLNLAVNRGIACGRTSGTARAGSSSKSEISNRSRIGTWCVVPSASVKSYLATVTPTGPPASTSLDSCTCAKINQRASRSSVTRHGADTVPGDSPPKHTKQRSEPAPMTNGSPRNRTDPTGGTPSIPRWSESGVTTVQPSLDKTSAPLLQSAVKGTGS